MGQRCAATQRYVTEPTVAHAILTPQDLFLNNSSVVRLIGRLTSDPVEHERVKPGGIKVDIPLVRSRPGIFIKIGATLCLSPEMLYKINIV